MTFNINGFKANGLPFGGARPSQFQVMLFPPFNSPTNERLRFMIKAAGLPSSDLDHIDVSYFGRKMKVAGDRNFAPWTVSCINDEDFPIRSTLEKWSNDINTLVSNRIDPALWPTGYKTEAEVHQFGKAGEVIRAYRFSGLFPTTVEAIGLDWEAQSTIEYFDCQFVYDYWEPINQSSSIITYSSLLPGDSNASNDLGALSQQFPGSSNRIN